MDRKVHMKNVIYFHICCINNWKEIVMDIFSQIYASGLYDAVDEIRCVMLGPITNLEIMERRIPFLKDPKVRVIHISKSLKMREVFTINCIWNDAQNEDFNVLYLHSKGVTHNGTNSNVKDWVQLLLHFNVHRYDECLEQLKTCDTVGINLRRTPEIHYSGNFWWSKSSYIKTLNRCIDNSYNAPEFWITDSDKGRFVSLWNSVTIVDSRAINKFSHYKKKYPAYLYDTKPSMISVITIDG